MTTMMSAVQPPRLVRQEDSSKAVTKQIIQELYERDIRSVDPQIRPKGRENLHPHVVTFLSEVEHSRRLTKRFLEVLDRSVRESLAWDPEQAQIAFQCLENYALNLLDAPWRREYKAIRVYNGFYQVKIQPHLRQALDIFTMMGYQPSRPGYLKLKQPISAKTVGMVACECFIASAECSLMVQIRDKVSYVRCGIQQIYKSRLECSGGIIKCVLWITNVSGNDNEQKTEKLTKDRDAAEKEKEAPESKLVIEQVAKDNKPDPVSDFPVRPKRTKDERRTISQDSSNDDLAAVLAPKLHNKTMNNQSRQEKKQSRSMDDLLGCKNKQRTLTLRRGGSADTEIIDKKSRSKERIMTSSTRELSESDDALVYKSPKGSKAIRKRASKDRLDKAELADSDGNRSGKSSCTDSSTADHDRVIADFSDLIPEKQVVISPALSEEQTVEPTTDVGGSNERIPLSEPETKDTLMVVSNGNSFPGIEDDSLRERLRAIDATPESPQLSEFRAKFALMTNLPIREDIVARESSKDPISESDVTPDSDTTSENQALSELRTRFSPSSNRQSKGDAANRESVGDKTSEKEEEKMSDLEKSDDFVLVDGENKAAAEQGTKDAGKVPPQEHVEWDMCDSVVLPQGKMSKDGGTARPASMHVEGSPGVGDGRKGGETGRPLSVHSDKPVSGHLEGAAYTASGRTEEFDKLHDKFQPRAGFNRPILSQAPKIEGIKLHRPKTSPTCPATRSWQMNIAPINTPPPCVLLKEAEGMARAQLPKQQDGQTLHKEGGVLITGQMSKHDGTHVHREGDISVLVRAQVPHHPQHQHMPKQGDVPVLVRAQLPPHAQHQYMPKEGDVPVLVRGPLPPHPQHQHQHMPKEGDVIIRAHAIPRHEHHHMEAVPVVCDSSARHYHDGHPDHVHYGHSHDGNVDYGDGMGPDESRGGPIYESNPFIENCTCSHRTGTVLRKKVPHVVLMEHQFKSLLLAKDPRSSYANDGIPTFSTFGKNQDPLQPSSAGTGATAEKAGPAADCVDDVDSKVAPTPVSSSTSVATTSAPTDGATQTSQQQAMPAISPRSSSLGASVVVDGSKLMTPTIIATPPSPMKSENQPVSESVNMWQCQACTFANMNNDTVCEMCNNPRSMRIKNQSPPPPSEGRVCNECTYLNKPNAKRCEMCEEDFTFSTFV